MGFTLRWAGNSLHLDRRTHVMGILNVTPDSFSDGGHYFDFTRAVDRACVMERQGADIIDIGGESTRPYSRNVSVNEELDRVLPIIEALSGQLAIPMSIDTQKAEVAQRALYAGAKMINDISALAADPKMAAVAAASGVPIIVMHMRGTPQNMQDSPVYQDLVGEVLTFLRRAIGRAVGAGVREDLIIVDPGIGFGKTFDDNLKIIRELAAFKSLEKPILLGTSNKAFIGHVLDKGIDERDVGTMATVAAAVLHGAHIVRVHNVNNAVQTVRMIDAIKKGRQSDA